MPTTELPVAWWAFWLVAVGTLAFAGFAWWLVRAALREDREDGATGRHAPETRDGRDLGRG